MDLQSFIQSGLLEAYVLGQCTAEERVLVERMAAEHPSVQTELAAIEQALETYAQGHAVAPPPGLKERIMNEIDASVNNPVNKSPTAGARPSYAIVYQAIIIALALLAGYLFYTRNRLDSEKKSQQDQIAGLQTQLNDCGKKAGTQEAIASLLRDRDTKPVNVTDDGKSISAYVYHNTLLKETVLDLSGVPAPDAGKYLQLWAIVDGKPVSMGMVDLRAAGGWQVVPFMEHVQAFAISAEKSPNGNPTPTIVVAIGKVG